MEKINKRSKVLDLKLGNNNLINNENTKIEKDIENKNIKLPNSKSYILDDDKEREENKSFHKKKINDL